MPRPIILPAARDDLVEIGDFIAQDNPARALTIVTEIETRLSEVARDPKRFPLRDELLAGVRSARHGRYLIFFLTGEDEVRIVRILHSARDLPHLLGG